MDLKEEVLLQVNSTIIESKGGPLLFILVLENEIASQCFLCDGVENVDTKLSLFSWKSSDPIGILMVDPDIYDYDDLLQSLNSKKYIIKSKFHYFPETSNLIQWYESVRYPYKLINCGVEIQDDHSDLKLLKRDLKDHLDRMIQYLEDNDRPSDEILKEIWLLKLRYNRTSAPDLDLEISRLESEIMMMQTMFNQMETNAELF
ncbi:Csi1 [Kluyveromyces lactis]|nr:Csi1 [Kluyveromyces lactis]